MRKKVGIVTVHHNTNYGANLQAFASFNFISKNGYDCEIINYILPSQKKRTNVLSWTFLSWKNEKNKSFKHRIKLLIALVLSIPEKKKRLDSFKRFREKYCRLSPQYNDLKDIANGEYTDVVCGSDQIWNPDITDGIKPLYFGDVNGAVNRISYAASMGKGEYSPSDRAKVIPLVQNLDYCSVREQDSAEYLQEIAGRKVEAVCDPVFLLDREDYTELAGERLIKQKYVLVYSIVSNRKMLEIARKYAHDRNLTLVEICANKNRHFNHIQKTDYDPIEFLNAFNNAEMIFTNSFHGTAFSIIFEKEFYAVNNKERGSRITNLLEKAGLLSRMIDEDNPQLQENKICYESVNKSLEDFISSSRDFLFKALSTEKKPVTQSCTGCGACKSVCKKSAISLIADSKGFTNAYIDTDKCVNCNLCFKTCPQINAPEMSASAGAFAFKAANDIRKSSTSGGAATAVAQAIIDNGGVVYGAALDDSFTLKHIRVDSKESLSLLQGTKYIQSNMNSCCDSIGADLENNKPVLFIGTPCQTAGVRNFAEQQKLNTDKLYLCDIICHGVPSPRVFRDYIGWLEATENSKIGKYYFRNKSLSWRGDSSAAQTDSGLVKNRNTSGFMSLYYSGNITNECCFGCKYTSLERVSDITISDFWGIEKDNPQFEDELGVSMVLVNTSKGASLFEAADGERAEADVRNAKQPQLKTPVKKPDSYDDFWNNYKNDGIDYAMKTYGVPKQSLKTKIYNLINGIR